MGRGKARDVFGEPKRFITIEVCGRLYEVPGDVSVQRALQYISLEYDAIFIDYGAFCWNNERGCCLCRYAPKEGGKVVEARICRAGVFAGQVIETLPKGMRWLEVAAVTKSPESSSVRDAAGMAKRTA